MHNPFARQPALVEQRMSLAADLVVFAIGLKSNDALHRACIEARTAPEIHNIGDSFRVGRVFDATKAGYATASAL
ncbi:MAG: hypothetical protein IT555_11840 [Acetobacteraceae bacterium]|nr:hypothetical protein [Acetobacteraceae bacterium]